MNHEPKVTPTYDLDSLVVTINGQRFEGVAEIQYERARDAVESFVAKTYSFTATYNFEENGEKLQEFLRSVFRKQNCRLRTWRRRLAQKYRQKNCAKCGGLGIRCHLTWHSDFIASEEWRCNACRGTGSRRR